MSTPIGNLEDITYRAVRTLGEVDIIAAEDTRRTLKLLNHYNIKKKLVACHEHNEQEAAKGLIDQMLQGQNVALVSDGGAPLISDPGFRLVSMAVESGLEAVPIPGACAAIAGLCGAGLPTDRFMFCGFLPKKQGKLREALENVKDVQATLIFYESPKRVLKVIEGMTQVLGDRTAVLAREITKIHEEFIRGTLSGIAEELNSREGVKGECTLIVSGPEAQNPDLGSLDGLIRMEVAKGQLSASKLSAKLAKQFGIEKKKVYAMILALKDAK
ncbi:16S rRNA (cytidine(1402)-2'-O)-methyltransferase [Desulfatibacillum alkenivorans]|uniref:16S rRNA (cytidine(1402)-2'-O)-methyltransferase n=1 Tax=Desulfatibacillum alkenivorans TaxID=259354 RepID=UPI00313DA3F6